MSWLPCCGAHIFGANGKYCHCTREWREKVARDGGSPATLAASAVIALHERQQAAKESGEPVVVSESEAEALAAIHGHTGSVGGLIEKLNKEE